MLDLFQTESTLDKYITFLRDLRKMCPEAIKKNKLFLTKIETELNRPIISIPIASEINHAIIKSAEKRKKIWNGGHIDDGSGMRFRLGQAVVAYLRWAHAENIIDRNCYVKNPFPRARRREAHFLTDQQLGYLYSCDTLELRDLVLIRFFIDTGLRVSQVCSVMKDQIDWDSRQVTLYIGKVDKYLTVPFSELTKQYLCNWLDMRNIKSDYLFCARDGSKISEATIMVRFRDISKKAGFRVNPHCLRHTAGTMWVEGAGQIAAMQLLGHTDPGMTNHYTHLTGEKLGKMQEQIYKNKPIMVFPREYEYKVKVNKKVDKMGNVTVKLGS